MPLNADQSLLHYDSNIAGIYGIHEAGGVRFLGVECSARIGPT